MKKGINELKFGHEYPGGGINDRVGGRGELIAELAANIAAKGLIQPLAVWRPSPDAAYYVIAGNRRLAALHHAAKAKMISPAEPIEVVEIAAPDMAAALDKALSANFFSLPPHAVDQFETFSRLVKAGHSRADIAKSYSLKPKYVEQILALGALAPVIREAWRADDIDEEVAQAYTIEPDQKRQADVYNQIKKKPTYDRSAWMVRRMLAGDPDTAGAMLKLVGEKEYKAAGGSLGRDLFSKSEGDLATSLPILKKLADAKIEEKCAALRKAGWKWAEPFTALPNGFQYSWDKASASDKKRAGAAVEISRNGTLKVEYFFKPGSGAAAVKGKGSRKDAPKKPQNKISHALEQQLDTWLARATQRALKDEPGLDILEAILARVVAALIQPRRGQYQHYALSKSMVAIREAITPTVMIESLATEFKGGEYFPRIPKGMLLKIIADCDKMETPNKLQNVKRAKLNTMAGILAIKAGWLPPELRVPAYDGPGKSAKSQKAGKSQKRR